MEGQTGGKMKLAQGRKYILMDGSRDRKVSRWRDANRGMEIKWMVKRQ